MGMNLGVTPPDVPGRIADAAASLGLPTFISCTPDEYAAAVGLDKKGAGADITLILLDRLGHAVPYKMEKAALLKRLAVLTAF